MMHWKGDETNMGTQSPRLSLTLDKKWMPELDKLKQEKFYNQSKADVLRYLIERGLQVEGMQQAQ